MKRTNAWLWLGLAGCLAAAGCPKSTSTSTPAGSKPATAPAPSSTPNPPPAPAEKPAAQPDPTKQPEQPKQEPEAPKATTTTPGGVEVEDLVVGTGAECKPHQIVKVFYRGTFKSDGKEFQSNFGGEPYESPLDDLVKGWQEGIPGMKVGGKRKLTIPYQLAYGERGRQGIPPKADLVFEIELVGVK